MSFSIERKDTDLISVDYELRIRGLLFHVRTIVPVYRKNELTSYRRLFYLDKILLFFGHLFSFCRVAFYHWQSGIHRICLLVLHNLESLPDL
jgi:hypothetical protein